MSDRWRARSVSPNFVSLSLARALLTITNECWLDAGQNKCCGALIALRKWF